jgi:hypothetical protein
MMVPIFAPGADDPPTAALELVDGGDDVLLEVDTRQDVSVPVWT